LFLNYFCFFNYHYCRFFTRWNWN